MINLVFDRTMDSLSRLSRVDVAMACGISAATLSLLTLTGYAFHIERLYRFFPTYVAMAPMTAFAILLCGIGIMVLAYRQEMRIHRLEENRR